MCRGRHEYTVTVKATGVLIEYEHRSYKAAAMHTKRLNGKKQPRLSRWYSAPAHPSTSYAKVIIRRACPASRVARSTKGSNRRSAE